MSDGQRNGDAVSGASRERAADRRREGPSRSGAPERDPFLRAENEDDDGYDPYSDRRPDPEPLFERDPWA